MTHAYHIPAQAIPPHARLIQMVTGTWVSGALVAAAKLNLADQLASAAELAGSLEVHAASLQRLMRTLASLGLLASRPDGRYELTALGEALQTGARGAAKATVLAFGSDWFQRTWNELTYSVETGQTGLRKRMECGCSSTWRSIPTTRPCSAKPWSASTARNRPPSPPRMISRHLT
jgi:hypothetical protein